MAEGVGLLVEGSSWLGIGEGIVCLEVSDGWDEIDSTSSAVLENVDVNRNDETFTLVDLLSTHRF